MHSEKRLAPDDRRKYTTLRLSAAVPVAAVGARPNAIAVRQLRFELSAMLELAYLPLITD
jgi:hypothetical protein